MREWEGDIEKEGSTKTKSICLTNLVAENLLYLLPHEIEMFEVARKSSQALSALSTNDFMAATRISLARDNILSAEHTAFAEKTFGLDVGRLKEKTALSRPFTRIFISAWRSGRIFGWTLRK